MANMMTMTSSRKSLVVTALLVLFVIAGWLEGGPLELRSEPQRAVGTLRVAELPRCAAAGGSVAASAVTMIGREPTFKNKYGAVSFPFHPRLIGQEKGVRVIWTPDARYNTTASGGGPVRTSSWRDGRWAEAVTIAQGDNLDRFRADALGLEGNRWITTWYQYPSPSGEMLEFGRLIGRWVAVTCSNDSCSSPLRVTDNEMEGPVPDQGGICAGASGRTFVFWIDPREEHLVPSLHEPRRGYPKVYGKFLGVPYEEPARPVTAPGRYYVTATAPVRNRSAGRLELVFFKDSNPDGMYSIPRGAADLYLTSLQQEKWSRPIPLLVAARGYRKERIRDLGAFRTPADELLVVYRGDGTDLRILRRDPQRRSEITTLANGVAYGRQAFDAAVRADVGPDGLVSIAYAALVERWNGEGWVGAEPSTRRPFYVIHTDGRRCLHAAKVTDVSSDPLLFDVAVDDEGRTHVVWVDLEGELGVMKHRWFRFGPALK